MRKVLERLSWEVPWKSVSPAPCLCRGSCGRKKTNAACPLSPRLGRRGRQQEPARKPLPGDRPSQQQQQRERRGQRSWAARRGPPPPFAIPCCPAAAGAEDASWQQQSPTLGGPAGSTAQCSARPPCSLAPAPACSSADSSPWPSGEGAQAAVPLPCRPLSSPQPGRTAPQPPAAAVSGPQGLASPCLRQNLPEQQGWAPTGLFSRKPLPASPCCCTPRCPCWPRPCQQPNLTLQAGAAHSVPARLAAARPCSLPCRLLVSLAPQGASGGPSASYPQRLPPRHFWAKAGSPLRASPSDPAARPAQAEPAPAAASRRSPSGARLPEATAAWSCGLLPRAAQGCALAGCDLTVAALTSSRGTQGTFLRP